MDRVEELFEKWKNLNKALKTGNVNEEDLELTSSKQFKGDVLSKLSQLLSIRKEEIPLKVQKFYSEWLEAKEKLSQMKRLLSEEYINDLIQNAEELNHYKLIIEHFEGLSQDDLKNFSIKVMKESDDLITVFLNKTDKGIMMLGMEATNPARKSDLDIGNFVKSCVSKFGGKGGGKKDYGQGFIPGNDIQINDVLNYIHIKLFGS
ncbi:MAG: hypothetical protein EU539_13520 [Promethearchaeota archaeon]|nr:MAG: hypothetical protein EU539_13520 [Candidatus Lokiarchaeota archaeon]